MSDITATTTLTSAPALDLGAIRAAFPSLGVEQNGQPVVYFDNPGGTQVPQICIDAIAQYLSSANANTGGAFLTSQRTDAVLAEAHAAMADFLNAADPREIVFGSNMTTLTYSFSRAFGRTLEPGDEIVVTRLDHDANLAPWLALEECGAVLRWLDVHPEDCTLDLEALDGLLGPRTRLVTVGLASNAVGTVNDVPHIVRAAHAAGALAFVDAVHYAPHGPIDVGQLGCDFLACSAYKFFGPHVGVLWGRSELLERFPAYKPRPVSDAPPDKWETGTQNLEGIAGTVGALRYLEWLGEETAATAPHTRRERLRGAMQAIRHREREISRALLDGLGSVRGVRIYGSTDRERVEGRVPTVSFTLAGRTPRQVAEHLAGRDIQVWEGNHFAPVIIERLGLEASGGTVRVGAVHYNTHEEIDRLVAGVTALA